MRNYLNNRVSAAEALDLLRKKSLVDGLFYYIGINKFDGWVEVFKATEPITDYVLSADEIDVLLLEKGLYLFASPGGWVTIRKVPKFANDLLPLRSSDEERA